MLPCVCKCNGLISSCHHSMFVLTFTSDWECVLWCKEEQCLLRMMCRHSLIHLLSSSRLHGCYMTGHLYHEVSDVKNERTTLLYSWHVQVCSSNIVKRWITLPCVVPVSHVVQGLQTFKFINLLFFAMSCVVWIEHVG